MKDYKKQLAARQELADATQEALDRLCTSLAALLRHQTALLRELRKESVRIDNCRWLEGDTAGLALDHLRASLGQGQPPKVSLTDAVARENQAIAAAIRTQHDFSGIATRARAWAGSHHAPQKDYTNVR